MRRGICFRQVPAGPVLRLPVCSRIYQYGITTEYTSGVVPSSSVRSTRAHQKPCRWQVLPRVLRQPRPWQCPLPPLPSSNTEYTTSVNSVNRLGSSLAAYFRGLPRISTSSLRNTPSSSIQGNNRTKRGTGRRHMPWLLPLDEARPPRYWPGQDREIFQNQTRTDGMIRTKKSREFEYSRRGPLDNPNAQAWKITRPMVFF
ncbi:hypothetical protein L209DRAFT_340618 [Thermothelomyces heterothallicus CBS 203.75]